ncbi:MAG TPA: hopanoid biosynthesis-associated protein HpnK [Steroidobacteraceae bacterium]|nr:hopanoid biosynthesis-associated protein HpnK [Steroidobacteraceae bacterium]
MKKFLIVTADDFGLHDAVNEAVERASRGGVLTAASLMVAAPAAADAVRRARRLPNLRVGLHLVLADGRAALAPERIPDLADAAGRMNSRMFVNGVRFFALPQVRRQLEAEIRAQFCAFARTGLTLDHVNVHKHFHLHPTLLQMLLNIGRDFGAPAVRVPDEPLWFAARGGWLPGVNAVLLKPWLALMKRRLRRENVPHNHRIFGVAASGAMDETKLLAILARLPPGVTEIYLHPAVESGSAIAASMSGYRHADELAALLSPRVRAAVAAGGFDLGGFADAMRS